MTEHLFRAGESLSSVADAYGLSGWQGLYFADVNRSFRQLNPDPWNIPLGVAIGIPSSASEQQSALVARIRLLEVVESDTRRLAGEQLSLLEGSAARSALQAPGEALDEITRGLVATTLQAIRILKASEHGCSRTNWNLAEDALRRWSLVARHQCALLLSLLSRAAESVSWTIPAAAARGWCDVASPNFWARPLLTTINGLAPGASEPGWPLSVVRSAQQVALANVAQQLAALRTGATMELNRLARLQENEQDR